MAEIIQDDHSVSEVMVHELKTEVGLDCRSPLKPLDWACNILVSPYSAYSYLVLFSQQFLPGRQRPTIATLVESNIIGHYHDRIIQSSTVLCGLKLMYPLPPPLISSYSA